MSQKIIDEMERIAAKRTPMIDATGTAKFEIQIVAMRTWFGKKMWYLRIVARANGETIAVGEQKANKSNVIHVADRLKQFMHNAPVVTVDLP